MKKAHIITVHGTWGGEEKADIRKGGEEKADKTYWWHPSSRFSGWLIECLRKRGIEAKIEPFKWSGENSDLSRQDAAGRLFASLAENKEEIQNVHLIAHSHGGNVAEMALKDAWGNANLNSRANLKKIRSV